MLLTDSTVYNTSGNATCSGTLRFASTVYLCGRDTAQALSSHPGVYGSIPGGFHVRFVVDELVPGQGFLPVSSFFP
jgi:hypothetical protein